MMMPAQRWGVMPQQRVIKSTAATRQSAQRIRKRSDGKIYRDANYSYYFYILQTQEDEHSLANLTTHKLSY